MEFRVDIARTKGDDPDPRAGILGRQRLGEADQIGLNRAVEGAPRQPRDQSRQGGHIQDAALAAPLHFRQQLPGQLRGNTNHQLKHPVLLIPGGGFKGPAQAKAGVVHQGLHPETLGRKTGQQLIDGLRGIEVQGHGHDPQAKTLLQGHGLRLQAVAAASHKHQHLTALGKGDGQRCTDATGRPGDQRAGAGRRIGNAVQRGLTASAGGELISQLQTGIHFLPEQLPPIGTHRKGAVVKIAADVAQGVNHPAPVLGGEGLNRPGVIAR